MCAQPYRIESDSMGNLKVPADRYWGAQTQRSLQNFRIGGEKMPPALVTALGIQKLAAARCNMALGALDKKLGQNIAKAAQEVADGKLMEHFPLVVWQTGSGTQSNMNANEVIAGRANELFTGKIGGKEPVHPNDHCNMGQSSNDTFPTAMHIAAAVALKNDLAPALARLHDDLQKKTAKWDHLVKIGRTHLMDATPIRVGQVFSGYAQQAKHAGYLTGCAEHYLAIAMPIGGTAVGTGINTHPEFSQRVCDILAKRTGVPFKEAENHPEAQAAKDTFVLCHGHLKTIAVGLSKIANDIRHLGSGPRCGIFELSLPATQPGSSIMPGKVNPVMCESVMQVACRVIGNDATVTTAGLGGVGSLFELNVAMPVMIDAFLESVKLLANVSNVFVDKLLVGLEVNEERCRDLIDQSLMMVTSLAPKIGYEKSAALAKEAFKSGKTIRQLCLDDNILPAAQLDELLDPDAMTRPSV